MEQKIYSFWLDFGIRRGWISQPYCSTHEGPPYTDEEELEWEQGFDPCVIAARVQGVTPNVTP